jgi:hypothetical protein
MPKKFYETDDWLVSTTFKVATRLILLSTLLYSRVGYLPYQQTLDLAGKAHKGQTLTFY